MSISVLAQAQPQARVKKPKPQKLQKLKQPCHVAAQHVAHLRLRWPCAMPSWGQADRTYRTDRIRARHRWLQRHLGGKQHTRRRQTRWRPTWNPLRHHMDSTSAQGLRTQTVTHCPTVIPPLLTTAQQQHPPRPQTPTMVYLRPRAISHRCLHSQNGKEFVMGTRRRQTRWRPTRRRQTRRQTIWRLTAISHLCLHSQNGEECLMGGYSTSLGEWAGYIHRLIAKTQGTTIVALAPTLPATQAHVQWWAAQTQDHDLSFAFSRLEMLSFLLVFVVAWCPA